MNLVLMFLVVFLVSWVAGLIISEPENHFLDALKVKDFGEKVPLREFLETKLDAVPGSETFMARLFECRVCVGSYFGIAVSAVFSIGLFISGKVDFLNALLLFIAFWFGSVFVHYIVNLVTNFLKGNI